MAGLVECYSFWTFSDIFEENYFPSVPFHGGFGLLNLHGIPKPTYHAFDLLHRLGTELLPVQGRHETIDAWVVRGGTSAVILLSNHALPRQPIDAVASRVRLVGAPLPRAVHIKRIDEDHANPKRLWQEMDRPEYLSPGEVDRLREGSQLRPESQPWRSREGAIEVEVYLPPHAVAAVTLEFASTPAG
jgi:xylan 1,4-beta-xylosidase